MKNQSAEKTFLTKPVQIAASGKTVDAAKRDLAGILKQIAENSIAHDRAAAVLAEKMTQIADVRTKSPADIAGEIARKREDLAAEVALGEKSQADLDAFEKEAAIAEKKRGQEVSRLESIKPLEVVAAGLRKRIGALASEAARLQEAKKIAARDLCRAGFEAGGVEYIRLAHELRLVVAKVVAWGDLHRNPKVGGQSTVGGEVERISLMPLGTDSTHNRTPFFSSGEMVPLYFAATDEILAGLAAEGLELFPPAPPVAAPVKKAHAPGIGEGTPISIVRPEENRFPDGHVRPTQAITE